MMKGVKDSNFSQQTDCCELPVRNVCPKDTVGRETGNKRRQNEEITNTSFNLPVLPETERYTSNHFPLSQGNLPVDRK